MPWKLLSQAEWQTDILKYHLTTKQISCIKTNLLKCIANL